jgi:hypothetical protein
MRGCRHPGQQRGAEVEVGAVGPVGELAQLPVAFVPGGGEWVGGRLARAPVGLLPLGRRGGSGCQLVDGALERALEELAVELPVDDDRPSLLELDQHPGGAGLVDVALAEADLRRPVGVAVELLCRRSASASCASARLPSRSSAISCGLAL